jgi:putative ABC transport system ATP-binding protein
LSLIRMKDIAKIYKSGVVEVQALHDINLTIEAGELLSIMGPSGSGKSTLMNIMGCLDAPSFGSYFLDDRNVADLNVNSQSDLRNRKIGFVFQGFNLLPRVNALNNVELPLVYSGMKSKKRRELSEEALAMVDLRERALHLPAELSGGQQQRVAIARALVTRPEIILADEPTGNLDSHTSDEILDLLDQLSSRGRTIIMVTHEDHVAERAHRTIRLRDGQIESDRANPPPLPAPPEGVPA